MLLAIIDGILVDDAVLFSFILIYDFPEIVCLVYALVTAPF